MLTKICQFCKKEFKAKNERAKYCSMPCMAKAFTGKKLDKGTRVYKEAPEREREREVASFSRA